VGPRSQPASPTIRSHVDRRSLKTGAKNGSLDKINFPPAYGCDSTLHFDAH